MAARKDLEVAAGRVVGIYYTVKDDSGRELDSSRRRGSKPTALLWGAGNVVRGLEKALEGKRKDDHFQAVVPPEEAYGAHRADLVEVLPREKIPFDGEIQAGMRLTGSDPQGRPIQALVAKVEDGQVTLDRNHPLAGRSLHFEITVAGVREATDDERTHGHPHGPGGHKH